MNPSQFRKLQFWPFWFSFWYFVSRFSASHSISSIQNYVHPENDYFWAPTVLITSFWIMLRTFLAEFRCMEVKVFQRSLFRTLSGWAMMRKHSCLQPSLPKLTNSGHLWPQGTTSLVKKGISLTTRLNILMRHHHYLYKSILLPTRP